VSVFVLCWRLFIIQYLLLTLVACYCPFCLFSPFCEKFIVEELSPTFQKLGSTAMDLQVLPFGNAHIDEEHEIVKCQHGAGECDANTYELCAIALTNNHVEDYLPFLVCTASTLPAGFAAGPFDPRLFQACAIQASLWWGALQACHDTPSLAWEVNKKGAADTPSHPYVPYVLLNGEPMADGVDFKEEVCRLYQEQGFVYPPCQEDHHPTSVFLASNTCPHDTRGDTWWLRGTEETING
jgi:interferon gamma-inducible protein 30